MQTLAIIKLLPNNESHNNHNNNNSILVIELKNMYTRDFAMYNFEKVCHGLHSTKLSYLCLQSNI